MATWSIVVPKCLFIWCRKKLSCGEDAQTSPLPRFNWPLVLHFSLTSWLWHWQHFVKNNTDKNVNILLNLYQWRMAIKLTSKHFNSQILFFFYLHISILQHAQARNKATPVKADQCGRAIVPRHSAKNNHVSCVSSLSLCSHLLKQSEGTTQSAQTSAIMAAQEPLYATSQLRSALFSLVIAGITQAISFIFANSGEDRPRITPGTKQPPAAEERLPKSINNVTCLAQRKQRTCHRWIK